LWSDGERIVGVRPDVTSIAVGTATTVLGVVVAAVLAVTILNRRCAEPDPTAGRGWVVRVGLRS
jgi:hypothetical protein